MFGGDSESKETAVIGISTKRPIDRSSIEGSPLISSKRFADYPTPATFRVPPPVPSPSAQTVRLLSNPSFSPQEKHANIVISRKAPETSNVVFMINCCVENYHSDGVESKTIKSSDTSDPYEHHQENAKRTMLLSDAVRGCLRARNPISDKILWIGEANSDSKELPASYIRGTGVLSHSKIHCAQISDILRVHEYAYVKHLMEKSDPASVNNSSIPTFYAPFTMLDSDTPLTPQNWEASRYYCGAAMKAIDCVMQGVTGHEVNAQIATSSRAMVIGRPPGHHAGPSGCVVSQHFWRRPEMASNGFCLLNTVGVAAAYARYTYGRRCLEHNEREYRVAIVDFDVHHGNGTEEIVKNVRPHFTSLPLPSSWAPVQTLSYKPWLNDVDAENVLFSSINLVDGADFYPGSGSDKESSEASEKEGYNIINIALTPIAKNNKVRVTNAQRLELCQKASQELRTKVETRLLPKLRAFSPDLLLISAGFDAHYDDMYHYWTEDDYFWLTNALCEAVGNKNGENMPACTCSMGNKGVCERCTAIQRECKVISVLEGGYSLCSTVPSVSAVSSNTAVSIQNSEKSIENIPEVKVEEAKDIHVTLPHSTEETETNSSRSPIHMKPTQEVPVVAAAEIVKEPIKNTNSTTATVKDTSPIKTPHSDTSTPPFGDHGKKKGKKQVGALTLALQPTATGAVAGRGRSDRVVKEKSVAVVIPSVVKEVEVEVEESIDSSSSPLSAAMNNLSLTTSPVCAAAENASLLPAPPVPLELEAKEVVAQSELIVGNVSDLAMIKATPMKAGRGRGRSRAPPAVPSTRSAAPAAAPVYPYLIKTGDGGLVKGVLAHVHALCYGSTYK